MVSDWKGREKEQIVGRREILENFDENLPEWRDYNKSSKRDWSLKRLNFQCTCL